MSDVKVPPWARSTHDSAGADVAGLFECWTTWGQRAWPEIRLDVAYFHAHLATCLAQHAHVAPRIGPQIAADLWLACACLRGDAKAWAALERTAFADAHRALGWLGLSAAQRDEVQQGLRVALVVDGALTRYHGIGPLRRFVRAVALRIAIRQGGHRPFEREALLADLPARMADPQVRWLGVEARQHVRAALEAALLGLPPRARNVLALSVLRRMTLAQIGRLYGVDGSTVSRWLSTTRSSLGVAVRDALCRRLGIDRSVAESLLRGVGSEFSLSLQRILSDAHGGRDAAARDAPTERT